MNIGIDKIYERKFWKEKTEYVVNNYTYAPPIEIGRFDNLPDAERAADEQRALARAPKIPKGQAKELKDPEWTEDRLQKALLKLAKSGVFDNIEPNLISGLKHIKILCPFDLILNAYEGFTAYSRLNNSYSWLGMDFLLVPNSKVKGIEYEV